MTHLLNGACGVPFCSRWAPTPAAATAIHPAATRALVHLIRDELGSGCEWVHGALIVSRIPILTAWRAQVPRAVWTGVLRLQVLQLGLYFGTAAGSLKLRRWLAVGGVLRIRMTATGMAVSILMSMEGGGCVCIFISL